MFSKVALPFCSNKWECLCLIHSQPVVLSLLCVALILFLILCSQFSRSTMVTLFNWSICSSMWYWAHFPAPTCRLYFFFWWSVCCIIYPHLSCFIHILKFKSFLHIWGTLYIYCVDLCCENKNTISQIFII